MIPVLLFLILVLTHYLYDWVAQTREQAEGKSHSNRLLTEHVAMYTWGLLMGTALWAMINAVGTRTPVHIIDVTHVLEFVLINGILHWCTDWYTSRINAANWRRSNIKGFFDGIGADQAVHQITLIVTAWWLLG